MVKRRLCKSGQKVPINDNLAQKCPSRAFFYCFFMNILKIFIYYQKDFVSAIDFEKIKC